MKLNIKRFDKSIDLPAGEEGAACFDFYCREETIIAPGEIKLVPLNNAIKVPVGHVLLLFVRSSTAYKKGLAFANNVGVIDPFYCGDQDEILAMFRNITGKPVTITKGERLTQGMIVKTESVTWNEVDSMNSDGHGGYQHY